VFSARAATTLYETAHTRGMRWLWVGAFSCCSAWSLLYAVAYMRMFTREDPRLEASAWIEKNIPAGTAGGVAKSFFWTPPALRAYNTVYHVIDPAVGNPPFAEQAHILD